MPNGGHDPTAEMPLGSGSGASKASTGLSLVYYQRDIRENHSREKQLFFFLLRYNTIQESASVLSTEFYEFFT